MPEIKMGTNHTVSSRACLIAWDSYLNGVQCSAGLCEVFLDLFSLLNSSRVNYYSEYNLAKLSYQMFIHAAIQRVGLHAVNCHSTSSYRVPSTIPEIFFYPLIQWGATRFYHWLNKSDLKRHLKNSGVVLFSSARSHTKVLLPIAKELREERQCQPLLMRYTLGGDLLADDISLTKTNGVSMGYLDSLHRAWILYRYYQCAIEFQRRYQNIKESCLSTIEKLASNLGIPTETLVFLFRDFFLRIMPQTYRYLLLADLLFIPNIRLAIFGNDFSNRERAFIEVAKRKKISTLTMQHGVITEPGYYLPYADHILVWSERDRKILIEKGVIPSKVIVVGSPLYLRKEKVSIQQQFAVNWVGKDNNKVVFIGGGFVMDKPQSVGAVESHVRVLSAALQKFPDLQLVIKPHPLEDRSKYAKMCKVYNATLDSRDAQELIGESFLGVVLYSTLAIDFLLQGVPVVSILSTDDEDPTGMSTYSAIPRIRNQFQLADFIKKIREVPAFFVQYEKDRDIFLQDYIGEPSVNALDNVCDFLESKIC